jgi:hypothetical protein
MTLIRRILFTLAASLGLLAPALMPAATHAQVTINENICKGAQLDPTASGCADADITASGTQVQQTIRTGINLFSIVVGIIAVVMILIGGVKYITSQGDAGNVTGAKNTILYAVVGLIVVALAQTIVYFVLNTAGQVQS